MKTEIIKRESAYGCFYEEHIFDEEGRLIEQSCPVDEDGNIIDWTETWEYRYEDDKVYSRHRMWGQGCFWTDWEG